MSYRLPPDAAEYVRLTAQTIQATATDENGNPSQHVLYLDNESVHSALLSDWTGPIPPLFDPNFDRLAAQALYDQRQAQRAFDAAALRQRIRTLAQSSVGQSIDTLAPAQVRALLVVLLWKNGAINTSGVVQPLSDWA